MDKLRRYVLAALAVVVLALALAACKPPGAKTLTVGPDVTAHIGKLLEKNQNAGSTAVGAAAAWACAELGGKAALICAGAAATMTAHFMDVFIEAYQMGDSVNIYYYPISPVVVVGVERLATNFAGGHSCSPGCGDVYGNPAMGGGGGGSW